jgi:hypothetical protein
MSPFRITKFLNSSKYSLELEAFEPVGGFDVFLTSLCNYLGERLLQWHRNWEFGIGYMTYKGYKLELCQREFPYEFSFDCRDEVMAIELKEKLEVFFATVGASFIQIDNP